jgi:hypothetical protein
MASNRFDELNRQAEACFKLARQASDPHVRLYFLDLAQCWAEKARDAMAERTRPPPPRAGRRAN